MGDAKGLLIIPVGFGPDGKVRSLSLDENDYLNIALSDLGGSAGVGEPKGKIVTPLGFNPSGLLRSLELDASDFLLVTLNGGASGDVLASVGGKGVWTALSGLLPAAKGFQIVGKSTTALSATVTQYIQLCANGIDTVEANTSIVLSKAATLTHYGVWLGTAPGAGNQRRFTVNKNGVSVGFNVALTDSETYDENSGSSAFAAGDLVSILSLPLSSPATSTVKVALRFEE